MNTKYFTLIAAAALLLSCSGPRQNTVSQAPQERIPNVEVAKAESRSIPRESSYSTTVQAYAVNNIVSQTGGRIRKIHAEVGDYVTKGQILAELDRLQLEQLELQIKNDEQEYKRLKSLYEKGGVAQSDFEAAELAYTVRKTNYENIKENTILKSPITGFVTARNFDEGDMSAMTTPIFTVQQVLPVKLLVGISESEYTLVKKGDKVAIQADAIPGRTFEGLVGRIYPTIDPATHTFKVEVTVENKDKALRPGMYARVTVNFGNRNSLVVPDQAIVKQEGTGTRFIYVLREDSTVSYLPVTLGRHMDREYEVLSGIEPGATVVVKGQSLIKDGVKVNVL